MTTSYVSPAEAAEELLARRKGRQNLLDFTRYTYPQYIVEPFHELAAAKLDQVINGEINRLMIFAPPQHGKSELVSVRLPAFWLGKRPNDPVIITSYGADLAQNKSREARNIVESAEFKRLFPEVGTRQDSRSVKRWQLDGYRGSLLAAGADGPITGSGALLGIIDDPYSGWKDAQSQTTRDDVWTWYKGTFRTRIWEGGAIILIMTRWHEDDLAGRLLQDQGAQWEVLRLPAVAETQENRDENHRHMGIPAGLKDPLNREAGEPLSPKRFSKAELDSIQADVGSIVWNAEYQGAPRAPEGNRFKRAWFQLVDAAPKEARRVRYWDKAGTEGGGAFTVGLLLAEHEKKWYVEHVVRGQWSDLQREKTIKETAEEDKQRGFVQIHIEQEPGSGGKDSAKATIRNLAGFAIQADKPSGEKLIRLEPFAAQAEGLNVFLVRGEWNTAWLDEITAVPNNTYWDQCDATSGAFNKLAQAVPAKQVRNPFYG